MARLNRHNILRNIINPNPVKTKIYPRLLMPKIMPTLYGHILREDRINLTEDIAEYINYRP